MSFNGEVTKVASRVSVMSGNGEVTNVASGVSIYHVWIGLVFGLFLIGAFVFDFEDQGTFVFDFKGLGCLCLQLYACIIDNHALWPVLRDKKKCQIANTS